MAIAPNRSKYGSKPTRKNTTPSSVRSGIEKLKEESCSKHLNDRHSEGFAEKPSQHFPLPKFPKSYKHGPQHVPDDLSQVDELYVFDMYFSDLITHLADETKSRFEKENIESSHFNSTNILQYLTAHISLGIVNYESIADAWSDPDSSYYLLGNEFLRKVCSKDLYSHCNRYLSADMEYVRQLVPQVSQKYWNLYPIACIDDNFYRWTGQGFHKQKIDKKTNHTGILSWEVVDQMHYVYDAAFSYTIDQSANPNENFGDCMLKRLVDKIPRFPFVFVINAGSLGSLATAKYLHSHKHKFVINCRNDRPTFLWAALNRNINLHTYHFLGAPKYTAISHYFKKSGSGKITMSFLTNLNHILDTTQITTFEKAHGKKNIDAPAIVQFYSKNRGFVNERKAIENRCRNKAKAVHGWRVELDTWIYMLLTNAFIWYSVATQQQHSKYSFGNFLKNLIRQLGLRLEVNIVHKREYIAPSLTSPKDTLEIHSMFNTGDSKPCVLCGHKTTFACKTCKEMTGKILHFCVVHDRLCFIQHSNTNLSIHKH
ncbi:hypothetical protein C9374_004459 [Naegleria lovaniensis]|uniref:PiggyBac transposable element-derived protein domain-containing protein n=1 Tax=Naegleria lovaniensis TaxID=51637 RepID=A0AA88GRQ8_NAELO|nr:uncharacterized protein C9374_004459 [Naegleria lovaniensis]KAG2383122.1 hypothetical protein C9374_004459 [Naegleria lovaniensis]